MPGEKSAEADLAHIEGVPGVAARRCSTAGGPASRGRPKPGGRGGKGWQQRIFNEEQAKFDVAVGAFAVGIGMAGPTIIACGTDEQQRRFLPPMLRGDEIWCQLFSEPGAGSDLAGLRTRAERDGDEWIVNGQKVWTSGAHYSDYGMLLAAPIPTRRSTKGSPRSFSTCSSRASTCARCARSPARRTSTRCSSPTCASPPTRNSARSTKAGGVANTMLSNERGADRRRWRSRGVSRSCRARARSRRTTTIRSCARSSRAAYTRMQVIKWLGWRARSRKDQGLGPESVGVEAGGVATPRTRRRTSCSRCKGRTGMLSDEDAVADGYWQQQFLMQWSSRIGGGTEQVQRNVIGERVLGLPGRAPHRQGHAVPRPAEELTSWNRRVPGPDGTHLRRARHGTRHRCNDCVAHRRARRAGAGSAQGNARRAAARTGRRRSRGWRRSPGSSTCRSRKPRRDTRRMPALRVAALRLPMNTARRPVALAIVAALVGFGAIKLVRPLGQTFTSSGDVAWIELGVRKAVRAQAQVGVYSRFGWSHPGPALLYTLAPWYWLSGESSRSLFLGAWIINGACAIAVVVIVRARAGELAARLMAGVLLWYLLIAGFTHLIDPWNVKVLALSDAAVPRRCGRRRVGLRVVTCGRLPCRRRISCRHTSRCCGSWVVCY